MVQSQVTSITPAQHAARHVIGGADPLIDPLFLHASRHASGGADPVTVSSANTYTMGAATLHANDVDRVVTGALDTWIKLKEIRLTNYVYDTLRITYRSFKPGAGQLTTNVYRNGGAVGTEHTHGDPSPGNTYQEDIAGWATGDLLQIYGKSSTVLDGTVDNMRVLGAVAPPVYALGATDMVMTNQDP